MKITLTCITKNTWTIDDTDLAASGIDWDHMRQDQGIMPWEAIPLEKIEDYVVDYVDCEESAKSLFGDTAYEEFDVKVELDRDSW